MIRIAAKINGFNSRHDDNYDLRHIGETTHSYDTTTKPKNNMMKPIQNDISRQYQQQRVDYHNYILPTIIAGNSNSNDMFVLLQMYWLYQQITNGFTNQQKMINKSLNFI